MVERLLSDILEMQAKEEPLVPIEVDPIVLMTDQQIKVEINQLPATQKALFTDLKKFAEDTEVETGACEPMDTLMKTLVKRRYPGIPMAMVATIIKPEKEPRRGS